MVQNVVNWLVYYIRLAWNWTVGEVSAFANLPWSTLPAWKWYLAVVVGIGIAGLLAWSLFNMWEAISRVLRALVELLYAFVLVLPYVVGAGAMAFTVLYVIRNF